MITDKEQVHIDFDHLKRTIGHILCEQLKLYGEIEEQGNLQVDIFQEHHGKIELSVSSLRAPGKGFKHLVSELDTKGAGVLNRNPDEEASLGVDRFYNVGNDISNLIAAVRAACPEPARTLALENFIMRRSESTEPHAL